VQNITVVKQTLEQDHLKYFLCSYFYAQFKLQENIQTHISFKKLKQNTAVNRRVERKAKALK